MLKPCPECGSDNISITYHLYEVKFPKHDVLILTMIHCKDCGTAITRGRTEDAYDMWNNIPRFETMDDEVTNGTD